MKNNHLVSGHSGARTGRWAVGTVIALLAGVAIGPARAGSSLAPPTMWYWHNWSDHDGVSHMTKCPVRDFDLKTMSAPAGPQWQDRLKSGHAQVIFTAQPAHGNGVWPPSLMLHRSLS